MSLKSSYLVLLVTRIPTSTLEIPQLPNTGHTLAYGTGRCSTLCSIIGFTLNCPELSLSWKFGVLWEQKPLVAHDFTNNEWVMHKLYFSNSRLLRPGWEEPETNFIMDQTSVQSCVNMIWDYVLCKWDSWHDADCVCCLCWFRDMDKGQMILFRLSHLEISLANLATWI